MNPRLMLAAAALLAPLAASAAEPTARERTEALVSTFKRVKADDGKLSAADQDANAKAFAALDGLLDLDHFAAAPIAKRADRLDAAQTQQFKQKFRELIRLVAYPGSGAFFREAELTIGQESARGDAVGVPVKATLPKEGEETELELRWRGGKVVDVLFDGDSMVLDYENQIARVLEKKGAAGLLQTLDEKLAELKKPKAGAKGGKAP